MYHHSIATIAFKTTIAIVGTASAQAISAASLLAQSVSDGGPIVTYVGVGGQVAAVGGLVYVVRALLSGDLVAKRTADVEAKFETIIHKYEDLSSNYIRLTDSSIQRETRLQQFFDDRR